MAIHTVDELIELTSGALERAGANRTMAQSTARALVMAEARGMGSHGLSRVGQYAGHLRSGRVNAGATPAIIKTHGAGLLIDADEGLAFPACELAVREVIERARQFTISFAGVTRSHHFGMAGMHLEPIAQSGMVGLAFSNSPAAMPAWGGKRALFGTNPIAAVFPRRQGEPITIDLSLSEVARGKLMVAAREGRSIPEGWAMDKHGQATTDPAVGLEGMMCPAGGVKGAMLALMVELLCVALTGASFGYEADSFFGDQGNRPHIGHAFLAIDPSALSGQEAYFDRVEDLINAMLEDEQVRLPGGRRNAVLERSLAQGIEVPDSVMAQLQA
ncbi:Ldh family oxidoreductase [Pusillimonas sp. MFBS29]|uniref:Ldh family oxidoreductase n=1 Tax=Pusillimonas sp. MFBS29 TaxID=2886690 RepID=UPI001D100DF4|nr:Ldh family oxidoreductase [Pusillimonas sp. MFBS29]MCC2597623.1 Ldh family oxidoreductase [Pusillimonas sp. MFBS29]